MDLVTWVVVALGVCFALAAWGIVVRLRGVAPAGSELASLPEDLRRRVPVSLHPVVDPQRCIGSAACVPACPEGRILRLHDGHAHLVEPERCIGHGACARECPVGAIRLVFGTAERGVDIPHVSEQFETNVPGIYIAGELGGMGLIRNAVTQGAQAARHIARQRRAPEGELDLVIIGAGPAGLSAALVAQSAGLRYLVVEQEQTIGGTIAHYPRGKIVMLSALEIPEGPKLRAGEMAKEPLMALWSDLVESKGLEVALGERLEGVGRGAEGVLVRTSERELQARQVLLAIGRRGSPRRLGVPGEDGPHIAYALREPDHWADHRCLVVGGGDSALEAALTLADQPGARVTLSYRGDTLFRARPGNRERLEAAAAADRLVVELGSEVLAIAPGQVRLRRGDGGEELELGVDQTFVFAGGVLPTSLLADAGIAMERKHGSR